jgi:hypothetical protein
MVVPAGNRVKSWQTDAINPESFVLEKSAKRKMDSF